MSEIHSHKHNTANSRFAFIFGVFSNDKSKLCPIDSYLDGYCDIDKMQIKTLFQNFIKVNIKEQEDFFLSEKW